MTTSAGVSVEVLLRDLNAALGTPAGLSRVSAAEPAVAPYPAATAPSPRDDQAADTPRHPPGAPVVEVDVREDLRAGREPFGKIMAAVGALRDDEVLHLRATFEPVPLFSVLGKRGFTHEAREHAPDDWSVWFWRPGAAAPVGTTARESDRDRHDGAPAAPAAPADRGSNRRAIVLDVRGLEPPEPLMRTLAALETLPDGHALIQVNLRVPQFLIPMLVERGYACEIDESHADRVFVRIWQPF
jgi:TusA-related sulfurtransferase